VPNELQPETINPDESALPEVPKLFAPGELVENEGGEPEYGFRNEFLPEKYQAVAKFMVQRISAIDMFARIDAVKRAGEGRFYWRGQFDATFDESAFSWAAPGQGGGEDEDAGDVALTYGFNIYQAFGRGFITQVGVPPSIKFIAADQDSPNANRVASSCDTMRRKIEYQNGVETFAEEVARLMWTDGPVYFYSRWVTDGSRFGYEDEAHVEEKPEGLGEGAKPPAKKPRQPKGGECIDAYGTLECKVPINMRRMTDFPFFQLSFEIDLTSAKSMYPNISANISGGEPGPGEYNFDRTTRIATTQGIRLLTQSGDTVAQLPTWQRTWIRPSFFASIEDESDRTFFEENFPDGMMVAFVGDTYAESRNESMDDHWEIAKPIQGDGQSTPPAGYLIMPVQDCFNDLTDLQMEKFMKAIPAIYGDKGVFDFAAISKEKAGPGAHYPTKRDMDPGEDIRQKIFAEPFPPADPAVGAYYQALLGAIPQFLTGIYPAGLGDADPNNETKGGILALRDASRGQQGVAWKAFRGAYSNSMEQLIRIGAYYREGESEDGKLKLASPGANETMVELEDLHEGNFFCVPDGDESYPRTHEDRQLAYNTLVQAATAGNAGAAAILAEPKNAVVLKDVIALPGLVVPGADETEKQLSEIKQLMAEAPIPNQDAHAAFLIASVEAHVTGQPAPPKPPVQVLNNPSVPIDPDFDNHSIEFKAGQDWINSAQGQQAKLEDPDGFMNVRLHLLLHKAQMDKAQQGQIAQAAQAEVIKAKAKASATKPKDPAESINYKDLGPSGRIQLAKRAGLNVVPDEAASLTESHLPQPGNGADQGGEKENDNAQKPGV
jgi:hypothetical protein